MSLFDAVVERFSQACRVLRQAQELSRSGRSLVQLRRQFEGARAQLAFLLAELSLAATRCDLGLLTPAREALQQVVDDEAAYGSSLFGTMRRKYDPSSPAHVLRAAFGLYLGGRSPAHLAAAAARMSAANRALHRAAAAALLLLEDQHAAAASLMLNRAVIKACKAAERQPRARSTNWRR